jgi:hypothetical protein
LANCALTTATSTKVPNRIEEAFHLTAALHGLNVPCGGNRPLRDDLQPLSNFTNPDSSPKYFISTFASELTFGQVLQQRSATKVAILKVSGNGTSLAVDWNPATPTSLYHRLVNTTSDAMAELTALGYQPKVKGLVWVQGEEDAGTQANAQSYGANLGAFFDSLRTETWFPQEVPIIVNQLHAMAGIQYASVVRNAQATTVAARTDHVYLLNNDDQMLYTDKIHYTGPMQLEVGRRLANFFYPIAVPEPSSAQAAIAALGILSLWARHRHAA